MVGRSEFVDGVVVGIRDMRTTSRVDVFADEVEQMPVGDLGDAGDAEVADVSDVHRSRGDLRARPGCR